MPKGIDGHVDPLVVDAEVSEFEQVLDPLDLLADAGLVLLDVLAELLPLGEVDQVDDHGGEVVG